MKLKIVTIRDDIEIEATRFSYDGGRGVVSVTDAHEATELRSRLGGTGIAVFKVVAEDAVLEGCRMTRRQGCDVHFKYAQKTDVER